MSSAIASRDGERARGTRRVEAGIRPQALRLTPPGPDRPCGTVLLREPLGFEDEFLVRMVGGVTVKIVTAAERDHSEGADVGLEIDPSSVYLFDRDSDATLCCGIGEARAVAPA